MPDPKPSLETIKIDGRDVVCVMVPIEGVALYPTCTEDGERVLEGDVILEIDGYQMVRYYHGGRMVTPRGVTGWEPFARRAVAFLEMQRPNRGDEP